MLKTLGAQVKEFKKASIATPIFMILEVIMEMIIPLMMASIIDNGVEKGDLHHIYVVGAFMVVAAAIGLFAGIMGGKYGAKASAGFAKNLRQAMFENIQEYSFSNIDKFSTAGLVTRLTTDVTNLQNAYQMILRMCMRAPASMIIAMIMSFYINARLASIYLVAVILLGMCLFLIMRSATKYFEQAFPKYDELNASVQENVSAIRVFLVGKGGVQLVGRDIAELDQNVAEADVFHGCTPPLSQRITFRDTLNAVAVTALPSVSAKLRVSMEKDTSCTDG